MSGRMEEDLIVENKIRKLIENQPKIICEYVNSFVGKTSNTKYVYVQHIINFWSYLNQFYDIHIEGDKLIGANALNFVTISWYLDYIKHHAPDGSILEKELNSCAVYFYAIKHFCEYMTQCNYLDSNPCLEISIPQENQESATVSLTQEEIQIIKNNIINGVGSHRARAKQKKWVNRDLCIVFLGITTGLRVSAIVNIDMKDINFENQTITTIEKGKVERTIYLSDKMMDLLYAWLDDRDKLLKQLNFQSDALFISSQKQRMDSNSVRYMVKNYTYNIDKKITPNNLRSTAVSNLYEKTGDLCLVADALGYKDIKNAKRYVKTKDTNAKYAADQLSDLI